MCDFQKESLFSLHRLSLIRPSILIMLSGMSYSQRKRKLCLGNCKKNFLESENLIYSKDHFCCPCLVYLKIKAFQFMLSALKRQNFCIVNLFADLWINLFHLRYPVMVIPSISRQSFTLYIEI